MQIKFVTRETAGVVLQALLATVLILTGCRSSRDATSEPLPAHTIDQESVLTQKFIHTPDTVADVQQADSISFPNAVDIDSLLSGMTLKEKIGQLFLIPANGYFMNEESETYHALIDKVLKHQVGGIMFSNGDIYGQAVLNNRLQTMSKIPLWITQDMEYGAAMRVSRTTRLTPAMGITATGNPEYAYWAGKITAREAKALGVHQIFAPVLDVNNNPNNPVINVRSFSGDPEMVATYGNAFIDGVRSEGVVATAKHFPGHGDTDVDSHLALPVINYDYTRLESVELVPFRSAINNGLASIMSAHISFPNINGATGLPGTMDPAILNHILTDSLNFEGVVVTDGLEMSGISTRYSPGEAVVEALKAGADLMLLSPDEVTAIKEIEDAVRRGEISEERIDRSVRKLLDWKKEHGLFENSLVDLNRLGRKISSPEHELIADEIARKSITVVKNGNNILPILPYRFPKVMVLSIADDESGQTGSYFASQIRNYHPDVSFHVYDNRTSQEEENEILADARRADLIIIGSFIYVRSAQPMQLSGKQLSLLQGIASSDKPTVLVSFGNPYIVRDLAETEVQVMAWSANSDQVRNTVPALFGASHVTGTMPIDVPGFYEIGDGIEIHQTTIRPDRPETAGLSPDSLRRIDAIMQQAIFDSTFPGGSVTVLKDGVVAFRKGYGYHTYDNFQQVQASDVYDISSLTKIVSTTSAVMKLVGDGAIALDDRVSEYIPEYREGAKATVTIRNLLQHDSGLPAFRLYIETLQDRDRIIQAIKEEPLITAPGTQMVYSDLGFILLGHIVERVTGTRIDRYVRGNFFYPMGMSSSYFNPSSIGYWMRRRIPPTEVDTVYRFQTMQAEVHDELAWYMDGVAGHAGLFSSGWDLAVYAQMLLNEGEYAGRRYLAPEIVRSFISKQNGLSVRGLGFDRKSDGFSSAGELTGPNTFGHLGFTGTSIWIDPDRNLAVILLTNRVSPSRSYGHNIGNIRAAIADAVISAIED